MSLLLTLNLEKLAQADALAADEAAYLAQGQRIVVLPPGATAAPFRRLSLTACAQRQPSGARAPQRQKGVL